ncbi:MAG: hypothetical protein EHM33_17105 [Chloroflexi bacterium]|nr:MAG: hypothetical protein EHM33_17105 [Chloroflexota bacterium]
MRGIVIGGQSECKRKENDNRQAKQNKETPSQPNHLDMDCYIFLFYRLPCISKTNILIHNMAADRLPCISTTTIHINSMAAGRYSTIACSDSFFSVGSSQAIPLA